MIQKIIIACSLLTTPLLHAETRLWKSADGTRSIQGEFLKRDASGVTVRRTDHKQVIIPLNKLHADDRAWLNTNHPLPGDEVPPPAAVFDQLQFGDKRPQVLEKLKTSKFVEPTVAETFFGRTGLNDVFRTRNKIGGLDAMLFFDWDENGGLREITLHTHSLPGSEIEKQLIPSWKEFINLLTTLNGQPVSDNSKLDLASLRDGGIIGTHLWKLENNGSILLGASRLGDQYQVAVRFTTEDIKPIPIPPAPTATASQSP